MRSKEEIKYCIEISTRLKSEYYKKVIEEEKRLKELNLELDAVISEEKGYGTCMKCKCRPAVCDYNGKNYLVCNTCDDILTDQFEDEYR